MTHSQSVLDRIAATVGWTGSVTPKLDWDTVERQLGISFPDDYKEFMIRFPSGVFRDSVILRNPIQNVKCLAEFKEELDGILIGVRIGWEELDTFPPFPEPNGVISFARDGAGGALFWLPQSPDPNKWHVVYKGRSSHDDWTRTRRSMTAIMLEFVTSRSARNILGWDISGHDPSFEPF